jgi:hypothetical protein
MPKNTRADLIDGLHALADWLEANPDVPVASHSLFELSYFTHSESDADNEAVVMQVADLIGATPEWNHSDTQFIATRAFGPVVSYRAISIKRRDQEEYEQHMALLRSKRGEGVNA